MTVIKVKSKSKVATLLRFGGSVNWSQHYNESTAEYAGEKNKIGEHSGKLQASRWIVQITGSLPIVLLQI